MIKKHAKYPVIFIWGGISFDIQWQIKFYTGAVKRDFRPYIRQYTSPNEIFEYGYIRSNELLQFYLNFERSKPH